MKAPRVYFGLSGSPASPRAPALLLMLVSLPDGVMVVLAGSSDTSRMLWNGNLLRWSFDGYSDPLAAKEIRTVDVFNTGFNLRYFCDWLPP